MSVPSPRASHHGGQAPPPWCEAAVPTQGVEVLEELHRWCLEALTAGGEVPVFGSPAWCALPDGATKTYAAVRAALAWWTEQWARADAASAADVSSSHAISAAEDWRKVARDLGGCPASYIPRQR